jgi:hypothetical protein
VKIKISMRRSAGAKGRETLQDSERTAALSAEGEWCPGETGEDLPFSESETQLSQVPQSQLLVGFAVTDQSPRREQEER